ncbi:MAG: carbohydrate ABC transporter permease [Candidatus Sericytochromatia bacterium]
MPMTRRKRFFRHLPAYLFVAPAMIVLGVFVVLPMLTAIGLSFTSWNIVGAIKWVGLKNYALMLADPTFARGLLNTVTYTLGSCTLGILGALGLAVLLDQKVPGIAAFRALLFLPALMSEVITAMVFQWLYNADMGLLNYGLTLAGLPKIPWLTSPQFAMGAVVMMGAWVGAAYNAPILLTGLQSISPSLYESAEIDGASRWQTFWRITLPLLRPFTLYVLVMALIGSFQVFGRIFVLTGGGPVDSTLVAVQYIYRVAFTFNQIGYASALSVGLFGLIMALTAIQMKFFKKED